MKTKIQRLGCIHSVSGCLSEENCISSGWHHICLQLKAGLDDNLQSAAHNAKAHDKKSLHPWIACIKNLDNHHITQRKWVAEAVEEALKSNKCPFTSSSHFTNTSDTKIPSSSSSRNTCEYPPKLTKDEHRLLMEHQGCLKCCRFYAGHCAHQCTVTISALIEKDTVHAKNNNNAKSSLSSQITTIASVSDIPQTNQTNDSIAAVFPSLSSTIIGKADLTDNSENGFSSMSNPPPLKSKHFVWDCMLTGPSVTFPINRPAPIDNRCYMVLIRPDIVELLGLHIFTLKEPETVNVAITFSKTGIYSQKAFPCTIC